LVGRSGCLGALIWVSCCSIALVSVAGAERYITVASTTSTENSGLYEEILPIFEKQSGIDVRIVAVGTGRAIRIAEGGDADVLLVHDRESEERFVSEGYGVKRHALMHNDFIVVGPAEDQAGVRGMKSVDAALRRIAEKRVPFVSRGDDSGTHKAELRLWSAVAYDPRKESGTWYRETGSGMGATLNTASAMGAYALSDRGTWLAFANKGDLSIVVEGDPGLMNPYGVILVNPERHPHVKAADAQRFIDWLISEEGQGAIRDFRVNGEVLFVPDAR
jgi:tungstate transport system substrate-binding protein